MTGTLVNSGAILAGSLVGLAVGRHISERLKTIVMQALGLSVMLIGLQMALTGKDIIMTIGCLLIGAVTGEVINIENWLERMAERLKARFRSDSSTFVQGFVSASLLYLTGAMMIVGSIQDGTVGDPHTLYVKSLLDGVASVALASSLGVGVAFSAVAVLIVQGAITLMAGQLLFLRSPAVLDAVAATGGVLILAIGINLLDLKQIRVGNLLPAVFFAIAWAALR
ncbi:MAG: putative membrane protein YdfK [Syntrophaceae bacterium PtaB.Bin095]|jgi:uncharacterized membrane protein YqgA involved in biofilm formation|nr:MAG: putative membrane protein YdfK [Syntrophaceae bacterium PtaB.Bin095]